MFQDSFGSSGFFFRYGLLFAFVLSVLADQTANDKAHCTAESCNTVVEKSGPEETEDDSESRIHLEYECSIPEHVPEEKVPVIFLHGMTDSRKTWYGIYQNIPVLTHRKACIYDARNHGDSGWNDTLTVDALAEDLEYFMDKMKIEKAVLVGHSLGGLTSMKFSLKNPDRVDGLFVEDIYPGALTKNVLTFVNMWVDLMVKSLSAIPKEADETMARNAAMEYLQQMMKIKPPESFSKYAAMVRRGGRWKWKANLDVIKRECTPENSRDFFVNSENQYEGKTLFIYGKASQFNVPAHEEQIVKLFPNVEFVGVEGADHMVHSKHQEFMTELVKFLQ